MEVYVLFQWENQDDYTNTCGETACETQAIVGIFRTAEAAKAAQEKAELHDMELVEKFDCDPSEFGIVKMNVQ